MSVALEEWRGESARALDEIDSLHRLAEAAPQRASALTDQIVYAYAALILAHFQRYCRGAHTEATTLSSTRCQAFREQRRPRRLLAERRYLDRGNPTPSNLGRDFMPIRVQLWEAVDADDRA